MAKFKKGRSGNPKGRPRGVSDKRTALRSLLEPHAEALVSKAVQLALKGDTTALRLCLDRLIPAIKTRDEPVTLGNLKGSLTEQGRSILEAMGKGMLSPADAAAMLQAVAAQARVTELDELEQRLRTLEDWAHDHQTSY